MRGDDRAVGRTIAVIVLMALATVALRGYLPGADRRAEPEELTTGSGSVIPVVVMLVVSIGAIAIAILSQALRRSVGPGPGEPHRELGGPRGPMRWRPLVIAAIVLLVWSLVLLALMRWVSSPIADAPPDPAAPPTQAPSGGDEAPPRGPAGGGNVFVILAGATAVLVAMSIAGTVMGRRRSPVPAMAVDTGAPTPSPPAAAPDLARAAELGLAEMDDPNRDPREAIIACYVAMERELEKSPNTSPRDSDTPSEVLARAIESHALEAGSATELVELFEEARFSPHVMNESHRADAVRALQAVLDELRVTP